jgi:F-type H+-transporting ATPase subunit delta
MLGTSRESLQSIVATLKSVTIDVNVLRASEELFEVSGIIAEDKALRNLLADSGQPTQTRTTVIKDVFGAKVGATALSILNAVATNRWSNDSDVVSAIEAIAARLAFSFALNQNELDVVEQELFGITRLVQANSELQMALTNPALEAGIKASVLKDLLHGKVNAVTLLISQYVVSNLRDQRADAAFSAMSEIAASLRNRKVAHVRAAINLSAEQATRLTAVLKRISGTDISLNVIVDPNVIGGVSVRLGDEVFDGSIQSRLEQARRALV